MENMDRVATEVVNLTREIESLAGLDALLLTNEIHARFNMPTDQGLKEAYQYLRGMRDGIIKIKNPMLRNIA